MTAVLPWLLSLCWLDADRPAPPPAQAAPPPPISPLKPALVRRELKDAELPEWDRRSYTAELAALPRPARPPHGNPDPLQKARLLFREAEAHLRFQQEASGYDAIRKALNELLDRWDAGSANMPADLEVAALHFDTMNALLRRDRQLLLTLLIDLDDLYLLIHVKIAKAGGAELLRRAVGNLWVRLAHTSKLTDLDQDTAVWWAACADAFADRPLTPREKARYEIDLASCVQLYDNPASISAAMRGPQSEVTDAYARRPYSPGAAGGFLRGTSVSDAQQMGQWLTFREGIEQADVCFRKALIHYQYGQRRQAVGAYREGAMRLSQAQFRFPETASAVRQKAALSARQVSAQDRLLGAALDEAIRLSKPQACAGGGAR